jgi:ribonucleoside-diphosphate reductase alpha chain
MTAHKPMPHERESITRKLCVGDLKVYATVGLREDGSPGEVFLVGKKVGDLERGLFHALALMISTALQHGVPLEKVVEKLKHLHFEPAGVTGSKEIPMVASIADYLARWLEARFVK